MSAASQIMAALIAAKYWHGMRRMSPGKMERRMPEKTRWSREKPSGMTHAPFCSSVERDQGFSFKLVCLSWSHCCGRKRPCKKKKKNYIYLKCLQASLLGPSTRVNVTSRCLSWMPKFNISGLHPLTAACFFSGTLSCALTDTLSDSLITTAQGGCVSRYRCERYRPWIGQSVFGSAEM